METKLKGIAFTWDEDNKDLLITKDKIFFAIPKRYLGSLQIFINRVYRRGFYRRKHV